MDPANAEQQEARAARLTEAVGAVLSGSTSKSLNIVVLNKALFYLDLYALRDLGRPITRATFLALPMGPVVAKYPKRIVAEVQKRGIAFQKEDGYAKPIVLKSEPAYAQLSDEEIALARDIGQRFDGITSGLVSGLSHENLGWKMARDAMSSGGGPPKPINMILALQQIEDIEDDESDPWLGAEPDDEFLTAVDSVDGPSDAW